MRIGAERREGLCADRAGGFQNADRAVGSGAFGGRTNSSTNGSERSRTGRTSGSDSDSDGDNMLMPLDDFRARIGPDDKPSMDDLGGAAQRYGVSLTAAALRWLEYTNRRAVFVVSRDGGAKWARSSQPALKSGRFYRTATETFMLPH